MIIFIGHATLVSEILQLFLYNGELGIQCQISLQFMSCYFSPHVNTELLLSTLANGGSRHSHMPVPMREKKPTESMTKPKARSAPSTPAITIEMEPSKLIFKMLTLQQTDSVFSFRYLFLCRGSKRCWLSWGFAS